MKTSRLLPIAAILTLLSFPLAAQVNDTYVITAVANQEGANGGNGSRRPPRRLKTGSMIMPVMDISCQTAP